MASKSQVFTLLLSLFIVSSITKSSHAVDCPPNSNGGNISVYWRQKSESAGGDLTQACDTDLYNIVIIAYLHVSGSSESLNLDDHCPGGDCTVLASQIKHCQSKGIKVLLSVEVDSADDPKSLAKDLFDKFLSGMAGSLGPVALDGIDFANINDFSASSFWEKLVRAISDSTHHLKILSAAPRCNDPGLDSAIKTGLFNYIWVVYYGNFASCEYLNNNVEHLLDSWKKWTSSVPSTTSVYLGLVASKDPAAASSGYIPPDVLKSDILPTVKKASNYGGVMLWNRYYDRKTGYSGEIKEVVATKQACECECHDAASSGFYSLLSKFL